MDDIDRANAVGNQNAEASNALAINLTGFHNAGPLLPHLFSAEQYGKLEFNRLYLTNTKTDNCIFVESETGEIQIVLIENFLRLRGLVYILGRKYLCVENMFDYPLPSSSLNELVVSQLSPVLQSFSLSNVMWKAVRIPTAFPETGYFFVCPLLHHSVF